MEFEFFLLNIMEEFLLFFFRVGEGVGIYKGTIVLVESRI